MNSFHLYNSHNMSKRYLNHIYFHYKHLEVLVQLQNYCQQQLYFQLLISFEWTLCITLEHNYLKQNSIFLLKKKKNGQIEYVGSSPFLNNVAN